MGALVLLLPLAGASWAALLWRKSGDPLDALLKAALVFVWISFSVSECLGAFHCLFPLAVAVAWCLAAALPLLWLVGGLRRPLPAPSRPGPDVAFCLLVSAAVAALTLCLTRLPQWDPDALLYHLPRVEQWVQNRCLAPFPTPYDLQVFFAPGAELQLLQLRLLIGNESCAGLVQWGAFVLTGLAVAGSVRALSGGPRAQSLGVLAWATLPMAVLQSSTAQNDLAASAGAALTAYFCLRHDREPEKGWDFWAAAAAGAALLLKGTNYLVLPAFGAWLALRRDWSRPQAARLGLLLLLAAAPSLPSWIRNAELSGSALGSSSMHFIADVGPRPFLSNALKAFGDELRTPSETLNAAVVTAVSRIHSLLSLPMNDPRWVFSPRFPYDFQPALRASWHEDYAGDALQTLALLFLAGCAVAGAGLRGPRYVGALVAGVLLYTALVRYNVWDTRLYLPFYALASPLLGLGLDLPRRPLIRRAAMALFAAQGLWVACAGACQPLALLWSPARTGAMLEASVPGIGPGMQAALRGSHIGLLEPYRCCPETGLYEYGIWAGARESGRPFRIQHLRTSPRTASLPAREPWNAFRPDVLIADAHAYGPHILSFAGRDWHPLGEDGIWAVFVPVGNSGRTEVPLRGPAVYAPEISAAAGH